MTRSLFSPRIRREMGARQNIPSPFQGSQKSLDNLFCPVVFWFRFSKTTRRKVQDARYSTYVAYCPGYQLYCFNLPFERHSLQTPHENFQGTGR
jgi:hypothetical protein